MAKKKVAILGGGCGSMTAAYYLSNTHHLREHLEVTVYQMGWRLGGKGASGRNLNIYDRIEEHGLHVWGGFYYNAFHMIQEAYGALNRPADCPLRTWKDAFEKYPRVAWQEYVDDQWLTWPITTPTTSEEPGQGSPIPSIHSYLQMLIGWIKTAILDWPNDGFKAQLTLPTNATHVHLLPAQEAAARAGVTEHLDGSPYSILRAAHALAQRLETQGEAALAGDHEALQVMLSSFNNWLVHEVSLLGKLETLARRTFIVINLGLALATGMIAQLVPLLGWMSIDKYDFAQFLGMYGAVNMSLTSAPLRGYYDYFFAYKNGDPNTPLMSAGMGAYHLLRLVFEYKGALFYKMASGMGDCAFGPLYEICRKNGVQFRFFHRVEQLIPSSDGTSIRAVRIGKQVDTIDDREYEPLIFPKKVPSWPSEPLYDQIPPAQVAALKARKANLEDPWTDWDNVATFDLEAGKDYDAIVLGLSIGAFPLVCKEMIAVNPTWAKMVANIQSIQTQALQLWWKPTVTELGWNGGNVTGTANGQPLESWSDMSQVVPLENWPPAADAKTVIYFCGPQLNPAEMPPAGKHPEYGEQQTQLAWENVLAWAQQYVGILYPNAVDATTLKWDLLVDPSNQSGVDRFYAQYARSNYTPTERYVVDLPGTNRYRLEADTSGYTNLALAGDWLYTGLGGAVEAAVIAGMQAARALVGRISTPIVGDLKSRFRKTVSVKPIIPPWEELL